ncbi:MAG: hypothetical protein KDB14_23250 [Planctomycetales bacterium]|nr:hypothetical protein [Planctomycetales bacterium]
MPQFHYTTLRRSLLTLAMCCNMAVLAPAQDPQDPSLRKDVGQLLTDKFTRTAEEAFAAAATLEREDWDEATRLRHWVRAGNWTAIAKLLETFEAETARRIHGKICADLVFSRPPAVLLPADVLALTDASPVELDGKQIVHVGSLIKAVMNNAESRAELLKQLRQGTRRLGGADERQREITAQVLRQAQLLEAAKEFSPLAELTMKPTDASGAGANWEQLLAALDVDQPADAPLQAEAMEAVFARLLELTPDLAKQRLQALLKEESDETIALRVIAAIGTSTAKSSVEPDMSLRTRHLELQAAAMRQVSQLVDARRQRAAWQTLLHLAANNWLQASRHSREMYPNWLRTSEAGRPRYAHVSHESLIKMAPRDAWLRQLPPQTAAFVNISLIEVLLQTEDIRRALPLIGELQSIDEEAAGRLANQFLDNWARMHAPNLSPEVLKQYKLDPQAIVLTRAEQEASLAELGELLQTLSPATRGQLDESRLAEAFDHCHSRAEIHTREHIELVFGDLRQLSPTLAQRLLDTMRGKLAGQWRDVSVQRDAATRRTSADIFELVQQGYREATSTADAWSESHPDDWQIHAITGLLYSDWAEFRYFQSVADGQSDRFGDYLDHGRRAMQHFQQGAAGYAAQVPRLNRADFQIVQFHFWFLGLLGISQDQGINLRKGVTDDSLHELRQALLDLPNGASQVHLEMFSQLVADNIASQRIAPAMKYRYLSAAVKVIGSQPTLYPAEEKIGYYESLLHELRLHTQVDGSEQVRPDRPFGVLVTLQHTADVARESGGFGDYLRNQTQRVVSGRTINEEPLYRDRFEESLRLELESFFQIHSIVFADPDSPPRDIAAPAGVPSHAELRQWQETPLCYLLLQPQDSSVDRVPSLSLELDFFDRDGKVVIPAESFPLQIAVSPDAEPHPASQVSVTQIVDARELKDGKLKLDLAVNADGLAPDWKELLDVDRFSLPIHDAAPLGGLQVKQLRWDQQHGMVAQTENSWTLQLDPQPLLQGAGDRIAFDFLAARSPQTSMVYLRYEDVDPVEAAESITLLEGAEAGELTGVGRYVWILLALISLAAAGAVLLLRRSGAASVETTPLFAMPRESTPFSVVALLRRIRDSQQVRLSDELRSALAQDVDRIERQSFARAATDVEAAALEATARQWLDRANSSADVSAMSP